MAQDGDLEWRRKESEKEENDESPQSGRGTEERGGGCQEQRTGRRNILSASRILADHLTPSPAGSHGNCLAFDGYSLQNALGEKDFYISLASYPDTVALDMPCIVNCQTSPTFITLAATTNPCSRPDEPLAYILTLKFLCIHSLPMYPHTPVPVRTSHQSLFQ